MSKKRKLVFFTENSKEKIEFSVLRQTNSLILEKLYDFTKTLLEKSVAGDDDLTLQMEALQDMNSESLRAPDGNKKNFAYIDIVNSMKLQKSLYYEIKYIDYTDKIYLFDIVSNFLTAMGKSQLSSTFKYIITQMINNANKSALKRAHFKMKNLDINQRYTLGIKDFFEHMSKNTGELITVLQETDFNIKVSFTISNEMLIIQVINNFRIHDEEIRMLNDSIYKAKRLSNLKDAYRMPIQTREGDGFGVITIFLFMRKIGLPIENFRINIQENKTSIKLNVPFSFISQEQEEKVSEEIVKEIDTIPMIPDNINRLRKLLQDKEVKIEDIEKELLKDPSLTADILKMANSAFYSRLNAIKNLKDAIQVIGLSAISNFILISGSMRLLKDTVSQSRIEAIMAHSEMAAYFAKQLIIIKDLSINQDDIYLATLLHDMGKIVVEGINPDIYKKIQAQMDKTDMPLDVIEDIAGGLSHSITGSLLAKKWNFPDLVCEVIRCHHNPRTAEMNPDAVFIVYIANVLTYYIKEKMLFENIDSNVLEVLEINDKAKFDELSKKLEESYNIR